MGNFDFDLDLRDGLAREGALGRLLLDPTIEVKSQVHSADYGFVFIEYESRGAPSGIARTKATHWGIEVAPDRWLIVDIHDLLAMSREAWQRYGPRVGGDDGTSKGVIVPTAWLLR